MLAFKKGIVQARVADRWSNLKKILHERFRLFFEVNEKNRKKRRQNWYYSNMRLPVHNDANEIDQ